MIPSLIIAALMIATALAVVLVRDLVYAVLLLGLSLVATAGAYLLLEADFVAAVQLMLYTGGVITLLLFGIMLSQRLESSRILVRSETGYRGLTAGLGTLGLIAWCILNTELPGGPAVLAGPDSQGVGALFLTRHIAAFEVLSALLLAAMIGAIVLARKEDAE